jgi:hypothetical protein
MVNALKVAVDNYTADIITMSYGSWDSYHDGTSQQAQAVDYAVSQGAGQLKAPERKLKNKDNLVEVTCFF